MRHSTKKPSDKLPDPAFGLRIKQARYDLQAKLGREVTHVELGEALGVTGATVGQWEGGKKEPRRLALIVKLAKLLHTTPGWLAFAEKNEVRVYTKVPEPTETAPASSQEPQRRDGGTKRAKGA